MGFGKKHTQEFLTQATAERLDAKHEINMVPVAKGVLLQGAPKRKTMELLICSRSPCADTSEEASPKFPRVTARASSITKGATEENYRKALDEKLLRALVKRGVGPSCGDCSLG